MQEQGAKRQEPKNQNRNVIKTIHISDDNTIATVDIDIDTANAKTTMI